MEPLGPLDYILDLGHRASCSGIENAMPGEAFKVLLYPGRHPSAERIQATGTLSPDGQWLLLDFITPDGEHGSYSLDYQELKDTISLCNSKQTGVIQAEKYGR